MGGPFYLYYRWAASYRKWHNGACNSYDCDQFRLEIEPLLMTTVAAHAFSDSGTGAFLIHCTAPTEFANYWVGACNSYNSDNFYTDNSFSLPYLGGGVGHSDAGTCRFHFHNLTHVNWDVGACILFMIVIS